MFSEYTLQTVHQYQADIRQHITMNRMFNGLNVPAWQREFWLRFGNLLIITGQHINRKALSHYPPNEQIWPLGIPAVR